MIIIKKRKLYFVPECGAIYFSLPLSRCFGNATSPDINYPLYTRSYREPMTYQTSSMAERAGTYLRAEM
jgi:hypothetical protein